MSSAAGVIDWLRRRAPTRESLEANRFVRPFAHRVLRSDLWRFNRRSVPRGIALGLFVGILIPFAHSAVAALTAVFVRANVPVAIAATWTSNPATWVIIFPAAYEIGEVLLHLDRMTGVAPISETMQQTQTDHLLQSLTGKGLETAFGLFVIATVLAAAGYLASGLVWRLMVARKRRARLAQARIAEPAG
ncbi:DUF2062 domain-containing protein [Novosphingobium aquiterrae]|uniref:DUF2062 domain-containing protein n=1 Tax=Novosphingobium aquiterrae TaxID=624388 RepID=A0ABV6PE19_9SPHN